MFFAAILLLFIHDVNIVYIHNLYLFFYLYFLYLFISLFKNFYYYVYSFMPWYATCATVTQDFCSSGSKKYLFTV